MPTYEIYRRESNQHRHGHLGFTIDGIEAELTVDPAQFGPKAMRQAWWCLLASKLKPAE